jgi:(2Fe-2S) ferredoxin
VSDTPSRRQRLVVCRGQYCNASRRADALLKQLQPALDALNGDAYPQPIKLEIANCLSMCGAGPNIILYPKKLIFNNVNSARLTEIIAHLAAPESQVE